MPPGRARYLLTVEYDGRVCPGGAQRQRRGAREATREAGDRAKDGTVQGELEKALSRFLCAEQHVVCGSRTDAGVHALENCFHVDAMRLSPRRPGECLPPHPAEKLREGANHFLRGSGIRIREAMRVTGRCHARFSASQRTYLFRILEGESRSTPSVFEAGTAWHVPQRLDVDAMAEAAKHFEGTHDFTTFRASGCQGGSPVRTLDQLSVHTADPPFPGTGSRLVLVTARAKSFLYHQVRLLVGALKAVGQGALEPGSIPGLIEARDPDARPEMAPGQGLFLAGVSYFQKAVEPPMTEDDSGFPCPVPKAVHSDCDEGEEER